MSQELNDLRKIAEAATPGNWMWVNDREDERIRAGKFPYTHVTYTDDMADENSLFIATFDPPTVLALLSRLEQAEQAVKRKQSALDTVARIVETQCEAVVLATDSQDLIGDDLDGDWDAVWGRLSELADAKRTAEQAVQRVREAVKDAPTSDPTQGFAGPPDDYPDIEHFIGNGEWTVAERVRRALDGDGRG